MMWTRQAIRNVTAIENQISLEGAYSAGVVQYINTRLDVNMQSICARIKLGGIKGILTNCV